jgi:hypothetical protein
MEACKKRPNSATPTTSNPGTQAIGSWARQV